MAVITEPMKTFNRMFRGYDPSAVDAHIEMLTTKQQLLLDDVESLRTRLKEAGDQAAALRNEVAVLTDTSASPHAVQRRMAQMLNRAVDEVAEMQAEARSEADALIAAAQAEVEAAQRKHEEELAEMAAQRQAMENDYEETKKQLEAELAGMRAETEAAIDKAWRDAQREADHYREQARGGRGDSAADRRPRAADGRVPRPRSRPGRARSGLPGAEERAGAQRRGAAGREGQRGLAASPPSAVVPERYSRRRVDPDPQAVGRANPAGRRRGARLSRAAAVRSDHPRPPEAADIENPSAAAGFGVGRGARPLRAGVQPARPLRPRRAGPRRLGPAVVAAAGRVLGARGRTDGRRRLAAAALADAPVPARPLGHPRRQGQPRLAGDVVAAVAELGPSTAGQIEAHLAAEPRRKKGAWWNRSDTKWVAEALFAAGVLTTATRVGFARHYDLVERVLPASVLAREVDDGQAVRELTLRAAGALGVATEAGIRDYFRLSAQQVKPAIAGLVAAGEIERVDVDGWPAPAYLRAGRAVPRTDRGTALLCPFDPLIFFRPRVERLFGFHYRIEIYTPAAKRQYGYYVWPLLMDGHLVARVDLKADRAGDTLRVLGAFGEADAPGRGWSPRWPASCSPWRRGWAWEASASPPVATWRPTCGRSADAGHRQRPQRHALEGGHQAARLPVGQPVQGRHPRAGVPQARLRRNGSR